MSTIFKLTSQLEENATVVWFNSKLLHHAKYLYFYDHLEVELQNGDEFLIRNISLQTWNDFSQSKNPDNFWYTILFPNKSTVLINAAEIHAINKL